MCQNDHRAASSCDPKSCSCQNELASSRRHFLQRATTITLGALSLTLLPVQAEDEVSEAPPTKSGDERQLAAPKPAATQGKPALYGFLIDTGKCIGAGKCLTACRIEHNVPEGFQRTWVERYIHFKDGTVRVETIPETGYHGSSAAPVDPDEVERAYFVPKICNHCHDAPCNQVCPVHAAFTSPEGMVLVDPERCIGCAYCVQTCPYGVRFINPDTGTADKCTWCIHRVTRGEQPACVEACPTGARVFGRLDDPDSEISQRLREAPTHVLKEHLGTHPKTRYQGLSQEVI